MPTRLMYAASEYDADMLYATRFFAPDAFVYLEKNGRKIVLLSDLEIDRGRATAKVDAVEAWSDYANPLKKGKRPAPASSVIVAFLHAHRVRSAVVPAHFPLGLAESLARSGVRLRPAQKSFWPEREFKNVTELAALRKALAITAEGLKRGFAVLRESSPGPRGVLRWQGKVLSSERLRAEIDTVCLQLGAVASGTIVAGGLQACDPHDRGSGPLRAGELIILDLFPRHTPTGYHGDLTRTVIKGRATDAQRRLWNAVRAGQKQAFAGMQPGADGATVHAGVVKLFAEAGFPTEQRDGRWTGFFHGTGHGLGLEVHEAPRFATTKFVTGQVLTVEPGLYVPGIGGARTEDVAVVTKTGAEWLSKLAYPFEL